MGGKFAQRYGLKSVIPPILVVIAFVCSMTSSVHGEQKIYDDLFSASFPNEKEGWASGRWGCILHTGGWGKDLGTTEYGDRPDLKFGLFCGLQEWLGCGRRGGHHPYCRWGKDLGEAEKSCPFLPHEGLFCKLL